MENVEDVESGLQACYLVLLVLWINQHLSDVEDAAGSVHRHEVQLVSSLWLSCAEGHVEEVFVDAGIFQLQNGINRRVEVALCPPPQNLAKISLPFVHYLHDHIILAHYITKELLARLKALLMLL